MSDPKNIAPAPTEGDLDSNQAVDVKSDIKSSAPAPTEESSKQSQPVADDPTYNQPKGSSTSDTNRAADAKAKINTVAPSPTEGSSDQSKPVADDPTYNQPKSPSTSSQSKQSQPLADDPTYNQPKPSSSSPSSSSTPHPNNKIALFCTLHPSSTDARTKVLSLLDTAGSYYRSSKSQCTTWSYFTPSTRPKAPSQLVPKDKRDLVIGGMEIYSDKQALSTQQSEPWYKDFGKKVKDEGLYEGEEELVVWYPTAGFVAREDSAGPFGNGTVVMVAVFKCKEGKSGDVVDVISKYTSWVSRNEPNVLTYCTMIRPKAPNEVLLFERYRDHKALGAHGSTKEFKAMFKGIAPNIEVKQTRLQEFMELDNAFVGNVVGVDGGGGNGGHQAMGRDVARAAGKEKAKL